MAGVDITRIAGNIGALNALNSLNDINDKLALHQGRLSTGKRINSAKDDPAGLSIATKMLARSEGLKVASDNIGDADNMLSVAEAGLSKMTDILIQMRNKAEQAASDTLGDTERQAIQTQLTSYAEQIDNIVAETKWNGVKLLDGTVNKQFQTGVDKGEVTNWQLAQNHTAGALNVSSVATRAVTASAGNPTASGTAGAAGTTNFTGLSQLGTGTYKFNVLNSAASATAGTIVSHGSLTGISDVTVTGNQGTGDGGAVTWANGANHIDFNFDASASTLDYSINDVAQTQITAVSANTVALGASGLSVTLSDEAATDAAGAFSFNYVRAGYSQVALQMNDGTTLAVDADGAATGSTATSFYVAASASYDTGRGVSYTADTAANMFAAIGKEVGFTYTQASGNSIDVSTAAKAADYMEIVNTAIDTVNASMSDLGSLMARLDFKSQQVDTAQVNVEASYNRIMNADMAEEQVNASKYSILQQTATAMLAQANNAPQFILQLFQ